jgi:hypothetical protein
MKKIILLIIAFLVIVALGTIPYWTGIEAEKRFTKINPKIYAAADLKLLDTSYQRGWFSSVALSSFEMPRQFSSAAANLQRLTVVHKIDHGLMPITDALINTTLYSGADNDTASTPVSEQSAILTMRTVVQVNGDTVSTLEVPALGLQDENAHLQWQGLQGKVSTKHRLADVQTQIQTPQIQLETDEGRIVLQNAQLQLSMQPRDNFKQSIASLNIADLLLAGKQTPTVQLKGVQLEGNNNIVSNKLMLMLKTGLHQAQVGAEHYGPSFGDFEFLNWHLPTLSRLQNTWAKAQNQGVQPKMAMFGLVPDGMALLEHLPELAMTRLNLNMPEGIVRGHLRVKMAPFEGGLLAALFNPKLLINAFWAQLDMYIPKVLLDKLIEESSSQEEVATAPKTVGQQLKIWVEKGILIPAEDNQDYYRSQIHLEGGVLQVNGQQRPITAIFTD